MWYKRGLIELIIIKRRLCGIYKSKTIYMGNVSDEVTVSVTDYTRVWLWYNVHWGQPVSIRDATWSSCSGRVASQKFFPKNGFITGQFFSFLLIFWIVIECSSFRTQQGVRINARGIRFISSQYSVLSVDLKNSRWLQVPCSSSTDCLCVMHTHTDFRAR